MTNGNPRHSGVHSRSGAATSGLWGRMSAVALSVWVLGSGCALEIEDPEIGDRAREANDVDVGSKTAALRGGKVVTGYAGVVDFFNKPGATTAEASANCTGSMIAPDVVLTAAHCFDGLGAKSLKTGSSLFTIRYYDPDRGIRIVYDGSATWSVFPTYGGSDPIGPDGSDRDIAVIQIPTTFSGTDHTDYLRVYSDYGSRLDESLQVYGAGRHTYSNATDNKLRTNWFEVAGYSYDHIVVDNRDSVSICVGDSGGPWVHSTVSGTSRIPTVAGVTSSGDVDRDSEGIVCTNNDPPYDDSYGCRTNWVHMSWVEDVTGIRCDLHTESEEDYRRCFELPFIEKVPYEGTYSTELASALVVAAAL